MGGETDGVGERPRGWVERQRGWVVGERQRGWRGNGGRGRKTKKSEGKKRKKKKKRKKNVPEEDSGGGGGKKEKKKERNPPHTHLFSKGMNGKKTVTITKTHNTWSKVMDTCGVVVLFCLPVDVTVTK